MPKRLYQEIKLDTLVDEIENRSIFHNSLEQIHEVFQKIPIKITTKWLKTHISNIK